MERYATYLGVPDAPDFDAKDLADFVADAQILVHLVLNLDAAQP